MVEKVGGWVTSAMCDNGGSPGDEIETIVAPMKGTNLARKIKVFTEIKYLVEKVGGKSLTKSWMKANGKANLYCYMVRLLGTCEELATIFGVLDDFKVEQAQNQKKERSIWSQTVFDRTVEEIIEKFKCIPSPTVLAGNGFSAFVNALYTKEWCGSIKELRIKHGVKRVNAETPAKVVQLTREELAQKMRNAFGISAKQLNLKSIEKLVEVHGPVVISRSWLDKNGHSDCSTSIRRDWNGDCKAIASELGVLEEYLCMIREKASKWTDEFFDSKVKEVIKKFGGIPCANALTSAGYGDLLSHINQSNKCSGMSDLRKKYDVATGHLVAANGMTLKSHAEVCFANFLIERGVTFKVGERYPKKYETMSGKKRGFYDFHVQVTASEILTAGQWLDVEIWGGPGSHRQAGYEKTRKLKEKFQKGRPGFLGIEYMKCYASGTLATLMKPYIGDPQIQPNEAIPMSSDTSGTSGRWEATRNYGN